ncbi:YSIRK signal domain/LPXTG anchor domain surface protein [Staphylococcus sp. HMSC067B04]|uniref:SasC/FmtB family protein n=1 Tax=Staphylococcus sp. HMSC067B04 TaxID=1739347 RepID=UPI0008A25252|nr:SasC/FmtB family protein [Staphylococcus sp. HMSC067B04]OFR99610.1 YSIRK signal domain/LPXTG anchor domain surface protein [Staphylococcus sp. HMSC067B04]
MNLFRKQKFSIRKFNIGIFSALIATVAFLAHPGQATASELEPSQNNDTTAQSDGGLENTSQSNPISEETTNTLSGQTVPSSTENKQTQNVPNHNAQPIAINTEEAESAQTASYTNINENNDTSDDGLHVNQPAKHHIEAQSEDVTNHTNSNHSNSSIPENKATTESSSKPKKRGKRSLDTNNGNDTTSTTQNTDPNLSNTGPNGINTVITFDDLGIKTSTNRSRPEVKVVDSLNGFTMVNGGKVGLLNSVLERTSVFDSADPKNYQAIDNVVALGRIKGNDPNDHDGFNGIEKEFSVNPNSEIIFSFNTMTAKNRKGGTQLVLRNAENNQEIASTDIQGGGVYRLFKLPDNVHRLKVQFLPMNEIHSDFKRIQQLHDGYRYYSFIDTIGVNSGSHLYVKSRQVNKNVKNGKEFEVNTRIENNGNFAAAIGQNELTYKVTLPENFEYVDNSTEVSFVNGNVPNSTVNPFSVNFDRQNHTLTFSSNGLNLGRSAQDVARFLPNKILNIRYKLRPVNISTPREVTFNEAIKYKTFSEYYINTNDNTVTGQQTPFSINVIMNKDDLSEQVNKDIIPSNYTLASYNKYNKLKERAQTVLDEETNNTPFNQRYSQTQIDDLLHELQTTLINRVSASREINDKAQEMTDAVYVSTELTTEEKDTLVDQIENHKNEISNNIDDELTDDGVERVKEAGLHTLESDTPHPVTKPNARQVVNNRADQQKTLIRNNHEATTEEQNEAIRQVEAHSSDAIAKIGEAETDTTVNEARDNGTKLIATDVPNPTKKAEARAAVTNSANSKIKDINNNTQATLDERNDAIALVNRSKDEAIQNINTAQGNDDVTEAQNNGTNTIQQVPLTPVKRQNAIATINAKADEQKRLIQANNNATTEEKADAERKVNEAVITANQNITNATTNRDVDQAQTTGSGIISAISPATKIKEDARAAVEAKAIAQNQQINSNNMATTEEKEDALNQVEAHKQAAIATINQAQSTQQVSEAKNNGINTINQDQPNAVKKNNTKIILEQKGNEKKSAIAQTPDATTEEKQEAVSAVSQAVTNGITHINQANSNDDVDQELSNAEQIITQTNVNVQKKPQARQALIAKTNERQSTINTDNEGTIEEKQKAIQSLNDAKNLADEQITQAASNQNVDNALNIGISNISKIQTNFTKKQQARDQVNQKFQEKEAELNSTPHATQDEKQDALTRLTQAKETALNDINQAQTNQNVDTALTSGIQNIQNTQVNVRKKQEAKTTINDIVQQHKQSIQNNDDATTEEKEVANNLVNASQQNVISKIDNATTNNQIDGIVSDGRQSINAITPDTSIKRNAKNDIDIKAADKKIKIQRINDATDEEIQEANRKIEEAKIEAKDNIKRNSTRDQVNEAKTNGINKIENITPATTVKSEARQAVQNKANEQINHIQNTPDATNEEKQEAINRVSAELARVQAQINAEHTTQGVKTIKDDAITSLSRINAQVVEKESARNAIEQKATQQTQFINNNDNATDEEKEVANNLVIATKQKSLDNINSLSSNNDVENAKVAGINEIANVLPATAVKSKAKKDIDQKLAQQINQIQTHQTATTEEKEAAIQLANQKSNEARTAIQNEHSNNGVAQAKSNGIHEIELVMPDAHKKSDAKQSIDNKYNEQSNTINTTPDATDEEKQKALDKLKIAKDAGYNKVDQAQTNQQVSDAKTEAIDTITNIQANVAKKPSARVELDSKFEDLKRQINATPNATEEEKQDAIQRLNGKRDEVKNLINQDRRDNEVEQHKNIGLQELETIHANPTRKSDALQELQTKFISQTELINNNKDATNEEKDEAKRLLEISKNKTITNINQAQTNNQVDNAKDNGMNEIATIIPATTIKTDAKTAIDKKAEQQVTIINGNNDATDEEKAEARKLVEKAKIEAKSNITNSDTEREVNGAKTNGLEKINNIQPSTQTKTNAKQEINDKAQEQLIQINNTPDATEEEKQEATNRVNAGLAQAIQNINNAHSTQEVNESKTNSIATIKSVQPNVIKKPTAINSLTQEANNQKTLIGNDGNATDDEKEAAKQLVTQKLNEQIQKIHESTQDNQVDNVKAQAITAIKLINANAHKRQDAINILTNLAESKKSDIRANQDATTEEKNTAIQSIDDTLAQARNNINGANTNALVDENLEDGKQKLQRIVLSTQTKTQAKADIAQAIGQQRSTIDQNQNATTEEKQEALERLNQETNGVNDRIQAALANQNVTDEKNNILETIRNVEPIVIVKPKANEIIRKKAAEQTTLINQNQDATLEEKQIALGKLEEVKNEALNQVSQAHSNNDVKIAENNGIAKISEVHPETIIKRNAKQEIEQDAQSQIDTINANNKSTNEEKSAAIDRVNVAKIDAINNITNATTTQLVNDAKNSGNTSISQILPSTAVKTNALAALASEAKNKNAIIDQTPNATAEEKEEANNKVDRLQEEADANILKAHTTDEVNNIKNQAVQNINAVQVEVIKKQNVKNQLNQFIDNQKKIIENTPDATLEEKAEANRLLQNVLTSTSDEIANVDHNNEVDQALDKARPKIEEIVPQVSKKRDVLNAIQEAFNSQTQEIQENQEATNEEKTEALNKINQLLNQAKVNIDQAQSNKDVDSAKTRSIQDIEQIQPHPQTKATGRHRLNEKANQQQSTIATHPNSTIEERQEASAKLQEVLKKAIAKIDKGQTNDDVEKTVVNGIAEIENILPATTVKDKAKADVNAEKEQKNLQINSNDEATTEEKLVASDNLNHVVETTNQAIEDAPDTNQVNVEKNKGIGTIRDIQPLVVKKPTAKSKIESAVEKKKTEINQTQNATHDEVREGLNQLNQIHEKAKNDVNQSQTNQQVENAEQNSLDQINNFRPDFSKKRNAVAEIVKAQQNKIDEIEQEFSATQEEKDNALQHLDEQVKEIINSINQANTDNEVDNAKTSGLNNITEYRPEYNKKKNAILKLYDVSDTQEAIINGYPDATEDELQEANSKLNKILLDAKKQIGLAHTNNEVDDIYNEVSQKMKTILPRVDTKAVARSVLNALAKQLIKTFENTADVTHEERNDAINHVKEQLSLVFNAIEKDRKDIQVAQDELFGLNELNSIFINITQKPTARKAISGMASQLNNSINNTPYATEEERQIALNKVKAIVDDANEKIREANTDSEVLGTKSNAITLLQAISADVQVKPQAFEEINAQAEIQRERINGNSDATREEKEEALKQVDTLVNHSFITINNVNKNQEVYDTKDKTIEAIHKIKPISTIKPQALNEITIQLDTQRDLIKNNKESTVEEKASAIDKLIKTAARIAEAIDKAQTNEEVKNIKKQSIDEISKILPVIEIKSAARNEIHQKAEVIRGLINDNEEATKEEKDIALNQLDTTLTQANVSIDQALTNEAVNRAKEIANSEINKISVIAIKKPEAIAEIQELADKKLNKFKQSQEATIEEKQSAINELEQALKSAINHIHQSQNNESVSAALKESISLIDSIEIQAHKKLEAKAYIDGYSDDKINDISSRATNEEKQIFVSKLKALINRTHKQIDEAETFVSVETIVRNFKVEADKLNSIVRKKAKASKEIELEADHVKQMINANLSASTRVKQNARTLINEIVSNALSQLNKVTTNKEVDEIVNETIEKLKSIQIREDKILSSQRSSTSMTEKSNQCYSSENNTIKSLPEAGNADKSLPLAGVTLISGLAIMSSRKKKKDKKVND